MATQKTYTAMQQNHYDNDGKKGLMKRENHMRHNDNPDYWSILVSDTANGAYKDKVGLDFGCGCGRNVMNIGERFKRMDGVDISSYLVEQARANLVVKGQTNYKLFVCDGTSLNTIPENEYDFVMSTIVMQHIAVHEIRLNYLKEFFRVMKSGGLLSFQMGFGPRKGRSCGYFENCYDAPTTNGGWDTRVDSEADLAADLKKCGFTNITSQVRPAFLDKHPNWIYMKAYKP